MPDHLALVPVAQIFCDAWRLQRHLVAHSGHIGFRDNVIDDTKAVLVEGGAATLDNFLKRVMQRAAGVVSAPFQLRHRVHNICNDRFSDFQFFLWTLARFFPWGLQLALLGH